MNAYASIFMYALIIQNALFILSASEWELKMQWTILYQFLVLNKNINIPGMLETLWKKAWEQKIYKQG